MYSVSTFDRVEITFRPLREDQNKTRIIHKYTTGSQLSVIAMVAFSMGVDCSDVRQV